MFDHFTFGAQPHTLPPSTQDEALSPTDTSFFPEAESEARSRSYFGQKSGLVPRGGISEIVQRLEQQSIQGQANTSTDNYHMPADASVWTVPSPSLSIGSSSTENEYDFSPQEIAYVPRTGGLVTAQLSFPDLHTKTVASRRLQRQVNVRLQSCKSHMRDIASLVEDMISNSEQCRFRSSTSRHVRSTETDRAADQHDREFARGGFGVGVGVCEDDEGFVKMGDELVDACILAQEEEMTLRRASTPRGVRKAGLDAGYGRLLRGKVRSAPRMRRRKGVCGGVCPQR
ncbi:unnamed protein product [Diplocarpon coronariae]|uniref:Uncharacterized protein n=1 Tax=Diplocarpon coronariae TaxID=2795749 RepID=A0A218YS70_9HELO|nr:hypothetical protein B2J93_1230 [Marssonina coronariae]